MTESEFLDRCRLLRRDVVEMYIQADGGHLGSALSTIEMLVPVFFQGWRLGTDRFVFSKGHGCLALYAVLGHLELISKEEWARVGRPGSKLGWHPTAEKVRGVEMSSGSLGLGPSFAVGLATGLRRRGSDARVFCLMGDGECNEGSVWEAALSASHKRLGRLFFLIDANGKQANGATANVCDLEPLPEKWRAFGFQTKELDLRRDPAALLKYLESPESAGDRPQAIICRTTKGAGLEFGDHPAWHSKTRLTEEEKALLRRSVQA